MICKVRGMGRSVYPWRTRIESELQALSPFRRALPADEQLMLDELMDEVRKRRAAGGMLPAADPWPPLLIAMLLGLMRRLRYVENQLSIHLGAEKHD